MKKLRLCLLAAFAGTLATAHAQMIGVNYGNGAAGTALAASSSAGAPGFTQTNYNNVTTTSATALMNNSGVATTAAATSTATGFTNFSTTPSGTDETLNNGFAISVSARMTLNLTGIPYTSYSLVVYSIDKNATANNPEFFTLGSTTFYANNSNGTAAGYVDGNAATPFTYIQATGTTSALATTGADYVVFTGLSGTSQSLVIQDSAMFGGPVQTGTLQAFQIINTGVVPEPSTWALLGLGVGGLGLTLRQRRRTARLA